MLEISAIQVLVAGKPVIDGLSMTVGKNEIVGLIGAPGCGKSTLLNAIFGLASVSQGSIRYDGEEISNRAARKSIQAGIVLVPQGGRVFRSLSVEENLHLAGNTLSDRLAGERIEAIFQFFPRLKERRRQVSGSLSGGERQMLALGMGLVPSPSLLLLDEPSTGLSPLLTERMLGEVRSMARNLGCTILVVEQNVKNAVLVSDRVLVMRRGKIGYEHRVTNESDIGPLLDAYAFKDGAGDVEVTET